MKESLVKVMEEMKIPEFSHEEPSMAKSFKNKKEKVDMQKFLREHEDDEKIQVQNILNNKVSPQKSLKKG